ncbi:MAG: hypothetical protein KGQ89_06165 [Verrucomicrobia bacterium]|nr:hypothetical protein [Verrucomicrobiota bacterium]
MHHVSKSRWLELMEFLGCTGPRMEFWYDRLEQMWSEKHRSYHTFQHLDECLEELDEIEGEEEKLALIEVALWFHDAIHRPLADDNEEQSAALAREFLAECDATPSVVEFVSDMILATKKHECGGDPDVEILVGLDLSIFARDAKRFDLYEKQIREEYSAVPEEEYRNKRAAILQGFLNRKAIYASAMLRDVYEEQARLNLAWSIKRLENGEKIS